MDPTAAWELDPVEWFASILKRPEWHAQAACRGHGLDEFFPTRGHSARAAQSLCASCPVVEECRGHAIADPDLYGIWGGTTDKERRRGEAMISRPALARDATGKTDLYDG
jgi:WhiB family redox-sensing transcriptional regulator